MIWFWLWYVFGVIALVIAFWWENDVTLADVALSFLFGVFGLAFTLFAVLGVLCSRLIDLNWDHVVIKGRRK